MSGTLVMSYDEFHHAIDIDHCACAAHAHSTAGGVGVWEEGRKSSLSGMEGRRTNKDSMMETLWPTSPLETALSFVIFTARCTSA